LTKDFSSYYHSYSTESKHTVTINGTVTHLHQENISNIDISKNNELIYLNCRGNFTSLDLSKNTALKELYCNNAKLTNLDASNCTSLIHLGCRDNILTNMNVSQCTLLKSLDCGSLYVGAGNQLTSLDVSKCTVLKKMVCSDNNFSSSDLNELFETLHGNTIEEKRIYIGNNPGTSGCDRQIAIEKGWHIYD
jgi:hypothetical protein